MKGPKTSANQNLEKRAKLTGLRFLIFYSKKVSPSHRWFFLGGFFTAATAVGSGLWLGFNCGVQLHLILQPASRLMP